MSGWALAVSFLALVVSLAAAWFAYEQKEAARATLKVESDRLTDERTPSFTAAVVSHDGGETQWYRLTLTLDTPWALTKVHVKLPENHGISFTSSQKGVEPDASPPILSADGGPLTAGRELTWRIALDEQWSRKALLQVLCSDRDGRHWTVAVPLTLPSQPFAIWE
ncbi:MULTISPECIES: hypothetical protein [Kribbella]|uniref:hypothetical protein n=1 Tax=Kribbella TaxID=182639 RepID=UPI001044E1D8|nr:MULTISPECIES: hypothetical protein [Kribbella]